jgi:tetratricopeptide (TPR) repeat protein
VAEPPSVPALQAEEAPDWLVDISTADAPAPTDMPPEEAPEWLQEVEIDEIEAAITPGIEEIEIEEPEEALEEVVDQAETDIAWEPEFEEPEEEIVPEPDTAELEAAEKEIESRLEWLQESAQAVAPEPEITVTEDEIGEEVAAVVPPTADVEEIEAEIEGEVEEAVAAIDGIAESIDVEIDDEEVSSFLEDLAESEMLEEEVEAPEFEVDVPEVPSPEDVRAKAIIEKDELPEDVEGGLEWLEQLATEDQIEEIVSPELPITTDEVAEADVPDWLQEVAEKAEDFSDEDADKAMLEALEELEIEVADEPAPESDADPSILDTLITRRTDLEEYSSELSEEEGLLEPEEPIAEREAGEEGMEPVFPPEATLQEDVHEEVEGEELIVEPEILTEAISVTEDTVMEEVVEDAEPAGPPLNMLDRARAAVQDGDLEGAVENYVSLINQKIELDDVIEDLRSAVNKTPDVPMLWQTLGDALMQSGEISEAIDAYRRGMEAV